MANIIYYGFNVIVVNASPNANIDRHSCFGGRIILVLKFAPLRAHVVDMQASIFRCMAPQDSDKIASVSRRTQRNLDGCDRSDTASIGLGASRAGRNDRDE
jgi:hypothetical protein